MINLKKDQPQLLLVIVICFWFAQYVYIPYQIPYLATINVSSNFIGIIVGAYGISQLALRLPVGLLADIRSNHKFFIMLGCFFAGGASLLRIVFQNGVGFFLGNIFSGFASATWISFMILYMSFYPETQQGRATSKIIMSNNIGMLLGFVTSTLLYKTLGMPIICLFSVLAGGVGFLLSFLLKKPAAFETNLKPTQLLSVCRNKRLLFFSGLALIQQGIQMSSTMSFTNQVIQGLGASSFVVGLSSIIYMLSAVFFARLGTTNFVNKITKTQWIFTSFSLLAIYCVLVPNTPSILIVSSLQIIPGMATGILFSLLTSEAMLEISTEKRSTAMGFFQAIYAIGMTIFPVMSGFLNESFSMKASFLFLAGMAISGAFAILIYQQYSLGK